MKRGISTGAQGQRSGVAPIIRRCKEIAIIIKNFKNEFILHTVLFKYFSAAYISLKILSNFPKL